MSELVFCQKSSMIKIQIHKFQISPIICCHYPQIIIKKNQFPLLHINIQNHDYKIKYLKTCNNGDNSKTKTKITLHIWCKEIKREIRTMIFDNGVPFEI